MMTSPVACRQPVCVCRLRLELWRSYVGEHEAGFNAYTMHVHYTRDYTQLVRHSTCQDNATICSVMCWSSDKSTSSCAPANSWRIRRSPDVLSTRQFWLFSQSACTLGCDISRLRPYSRTNRRSSDIPANSVSASMPSNSQALFNPMEL